MTEPTPAPAAAPTPAPTHESVGQHIRSFFEKDIEPRLEAAEGDVANLKSLAPELATFANSIVAAVKAVAPNAAPEVAAVLAAAEKGAGEIVRIAAELGAAGV